MKIKKILKLSIKRPLQSQVSNPESLKRPGLIIETIEYLIHLVSLV